MPWYSGPTFIETLDNIPQPNSPNELPTRLPIQDIYKFDERRIIAGRIESGTLKINDTLLFSPSNKRAAVASFETWNTKEKKTKAMAGESVAIVLSWALFISIATLTALKLSRCCIDCNVSFV